MTVGVSCKVEAASCAGGLGIAEDETAAWVSMPRVRKPRCRQFHAVFAANWAFTARLKKIVEARHCAPERVALLQG